MSYGRQKRRVREKEETFIAGETMDAEKFANDPESREQWQAYEGFISFFKWSTIAIIVSLVLMAIFLV